MILSESPFFCPAIRKLKKNLSCDHISKVDQFLVSDQKKKIHQNRVLLRLIGQTCKTKAASNNVHAAIANDFKVPVQGVNHAIKGIGINNFFQGKNIFITGGTGLLGKVLVEKILRSLPVGKIYVLVKADGAEAAIDRIAKELVNSELFRCLEAKQGNYYRAFIKETLIPVVGNICEPNLGMDLASAHAIKENVNVIIESAADTTLNGRYDLLLQTNVHAPQRLMAFAKACKNLELLVHISTAYVSGERQGIIPEKPMLMGECRRHDSNDDLRLSIANEVDLALKAYKSNSTNYDTSKDLKRLGMERARLHGWYNTYHLTKAMAEMVMHETREDIPVIIVRPTFIESCYKEPVPGWLQGNRMFDPFIISYGKGQLPAILAKPDAPMDIIPLDMVVNATIAAIAKHGYTHKSELNVYQMASSVVNPLKYSEFFEYLYEYFISQPLVESQNFNRISYYNNVERIKYFNNFDELSTFTREEMYRRSDGILRTIEGKQKLRTQCKAKSIYAEQLCKIYDFFGFFKARFDAENSQKLLSEMSKEEKDEFEMDATKIEWKKYIQEIHVPGLIKHVLNDKRVSV